MSTKYVVVVFMYNPPAYEVFDSVDNVMSSFDITWSKLGVKPEIDWSEVRAGQTSIKFNGTVVGEVALRAINDGPIHF